jgi:hypothetical protein
MANTDTAIATIRRQRQAFAYGIEALHTLYNTGREASEPMKRLQTKTEAGPVYTTPLVNARKKMNTQLERATSNQLAMQLLVGVCEQVKQVRPHWPEDPSPTIRVLRLLRHGIAHGNEVSYEGDDPHPKTVWRGFKFTEEIEGDQLFTQPAEYMWGTEKVEMVEGYFEAGDALALTTDVLELLIETSDRYDEGNVVGLSYNNSSEWENI